MNRNPAEDESPAIRHQYEEHGVEGYYAQFGADYRNPHEAVIREVLREAVERWRLDLTQVLDLACGSGEATLVLRELGAGEIDGVDPYTDEAYLARTGKTAENFSFEQIAAGALAGRSYSLIVCSFAMHLIEESWLPALMARLAMISSSLLIITPHKRPEIKSDWGWELADEFLIERVRARLYRTKP
jgi:trans-aconitate methyltransferase